MDKKKKKNSGNWNTQKRNQQNKENNNAVNRPKEFRFDNSNYQNSNFEKQIQICEDLYGINLVIDRNIHISQKMKENIRQQYGERVADRVCDVFEHQKWLTEYLSNPRE